MLTPALTSGHRFWWVCPVLAESNHFGCVTLCLYPDSHTTFPSSCCPGVGDDDNDRSAMSNTYFMPGSVLQHFSSIDTFMPHNNLGCSFSHYFYFTDEEMTQRAQTACLTWNSLPVLPPAWTPLLQEDPMMWVSTSCLCPMSIHCGLPEARRMSVHHCPWAQHILNHTKGCWIKESWVTSVLRGSWDHGPLVVSWLPVLWPHCICNAEISEQISDQICA